MATTKGKIIHSRLHPKDFKAVEDYAKKKDFTISGLIRYALFRHIGWDSTDHKPFKY